MSKSPHNSFNLADHVLDNSSDVSANRRRLMECLPAGSKVSWLNQMHGNRVVRADKVSATTQADASCSDSENLACAVLTADCLPVLMCSRDGTVVAAAHAGWRGLLAGVLENTVRSMNAPASDILAWLGPAIGPDAFEVGPEVRQAFLNASGPECLPETEACFATSHKNRSHFLADLYALARLRLRDLNAANIYGGQFCTYADNRRFFSFRRDGETGRMASIILKQPANCRS